MLKNYFKIAWRNIVKNRFYSLVNIAGLSAGIAFTLLIGGYVWSEFQVNKEIKNSDHQYILQSKWKDPNQGLDITTVGPLAKALKENYPNLVANYFRWDGITSAVSRGDKSFREGIQICDSTLFSMYGFKLLHGDPKHAFEGPYSVVLTNDKALKYFGKEDVVGETVTIENFAGSKHDFIITGVLKKPYKNSVTFLTDENDNQFYISSNNIGFFGRNMDWNNPYIVGYIELQKGVSPKDLEKPMQDLLKKNAPSQIFENMRPYLLTLKEYYLSYNNGLVRKMITTLLWIVLFILIMAIINFINLSVSRSAARMREIGVRKVLGGLKGQLILQFLLESIILVLFATILALFIYVFTKGFFSTILKKEMPALTDFPVYFIFFPFLLIIVVGFLAGIYPAFVLSSLKSVESLKGKLNSVKENVVLRKSLVAFQFATATIVFVGAFLISKQVQLFFSKNLGYNKDYIIAAQIPRDWTPKGVRRMEYLRKQLASMPMVKEISLSFGLPDGSSPGSFSVFNAGADSITAIASQNIYTDEYFASTYGIPMAAGEFYGPPGSVTDSSKLVINETLAKALGMKNANDAIGSQVMAQGGTTIFTIAGVTKDFHFGSMQQTIPPLTFLNVGVLIYSEPFLLN